MKPVFWLRLLAAATLFLCLFQASYAQGPCLPDRTLSATIGAAININTGVDENLDVLFFGVVDPRWMIVGNTLPPLITIDRWNFTAATSQWISFDNENTTVTHYTVRFEFCTESCGDYRLNFRMLADNGACVYLDGQLVPSSWWLGGSIADCNIIPTDQSSYIPTAGYLIDQTLNLAEGVHTIEIDMLNFSSSLTGINIMGGIETVAIETYECICPPDRTLGDAVGDAININTGVDENLNVLPYFVVDPRWTLVSTTLPPMSTIDRDNFTELTSQWIAFDDNQGTSETNYKVRFDFCTVVCGDYRLNFRMLVDNGACVYLDGQPVPSSWWLGGSIADCTIFPDDISTFIPTAGYLIDHTLSLAAGVHTLEIEVFNFSGTLTAINIMGSIATVEPNTCICPPDRTIGATVGASININTGVDENLNVLPFEVDDPRWMIVSTTLPPMATVDRGNFTEAISQWIAFDNNEGSNETNYKVRFEFCTETCGDYRLYFRMMADNGACVYLDGQLVPSSWFLGGSIADCTIIPIDQSPFIPTAGYLIDHTLSLPGGVHTLEIEVFNYAGSITSINIMGGIELTGACDVSITDAQKLSADLSLFPNPAQEHLSITWNKTSIQNIRLVDVWGKQIRLINVPEHSSQLEIPLNNLIPGTYLLVCQDKSGQVFNKRFIKM